MVVALLLVTYVPAISMTLPALLMGAYSDRFFSQTGLRIAVKENTMGA